MGHDDTLAARMRAEYVGEDAIAFDELKPEVRARWERVAAVGKTKPPVTREAIARALEDRWCLPGVPTPYEEADVVLAVLAECGEDDDTPIAICPQCYRAHAAVSDRASDEELEHVFEQGREEGALVNMEGIRAVRARVEAPLLDEIDRLDIENRDRAFYVEQFAAVSQERDAARAELAALRQPTPEPIASPDVLERLAELMADEMGDPTITRTPHGMQRRMKAVVAILRAARAYVDLHSDSIIVYRCGQTQIHGNEIAALNSRIRYRVALPETPNAQMQRCINRKNRRIDALKAIAKKWKAKATETPKGLPSVQDLHDAYSAGLASKSINEVHPTWGSFALTALRPWLREPMGWELDVTADELAPLYWRARGTNDNIREFDQLCENDKKQILNGLAFSIDLCRSRIRPTFECAECAKKDELYRATEKQLVLANNRLYTARRDYCEVLAAIGRTNEAIHEIAAARAALEGE